MLRNSLGFTLLEFVVAFAVLAVAGLGLMSLTSRAISANVRGENHAAAAHLAAAKIEDLKNTGFDALAGGSDGPMDAAGDAGGVFSRTWTVATETITGVTTPAKTIAVTVTWTGGGSVTMTSMVVDPGEVTPGFIAGFPTASIKSMEQIQ